ncbi:restriction endonuclease fold toxin-2 domain-containing protein [Streptomyces sp. L7]
MDGYLVEAKHVRDPDCTKGSFRSLARVNDTLAKPVKVDANGNPKWDPVIDSMYGDDSRELTRYKKAMDNPANSEIRGLEIVTNGKTNAAYWESMMAMNGVTGSARYVPWKPRKLVSVPRNVRTTFGFYPPENNPAAWQADLETFRNALERAFSDGAMERRVDPLRRRRRAGLRHRGRARDLDHGYRGDADPRLRVYHPGERDRRRGR